METTLSFRLVSFSNLAGSDLRTSCKSDFQPPHGHTMPHRTRWSSERGSYRLKGKVSPLSFNFNWWFNLYSWFHSASVTDIVMDAQIALVPFISPGVKLPCMRHLRYIRWTLTVVVFCRSGSSSAQWVSPLVRPIVCWRAFDGYRSYLPQMGFRCNSDYHYYWKRTGALPHLLACYDRPLPRWVPCRSWGCYFATKLWDNVSRFVSHRSTEVISRTSR